MPARPDRASDPAPASPRSRPAPEPSSGEPLFHERLLPGVGSWIVAVALGGVLGLALVPLDLTVAIIVGVIAILIALGLAVLYSPVLEVSEHRFRLGRAQIDVDLLGPAQVLRGEDWQRTVGQDFEPLAHHCLRVWAPSGIRVEVLDPEDPTTAWVASSRRPEDLALALRTAQQHDEPGPSA
ncbi:DUF3093 domain-containing protein [Brachybacterium sp. YJGR34]|uniref:DUF3093 domain-containing protein n=1 Tax=Brachybacterium sp. YJGR34 TaxID=2059911 RepID=UPI000E0A35DA|nr:DUF3093 domain-containing protein [Brachybacterium sp. YJGR34]